MSLSHFTKKNLRRRTIAQTETVGGDPYYNSVVALLNFDGAEGSTSFIEEKGKTVTGYGNAVIKRSTNGGMAYFDGVGDYLALADSADLDLVGDFTIELWFNANNVTTAGYILSDPGAPLQGYCSYQIRVENGNLTFLATYSNSAWNINAGISVVSTGRWYHVAVSKSGTSLRYFLDGEQKGTTTMSSAPYNTSSELRIGETFSGYIDGVRIAKGVARYLTSFVPPATPLPNFLSYEISTTYDLWEEGDPYWNSVVALLNFDSADGSTAFIEEKGKTVTGYGNSVIKRSTSGGTAYFDGAGDYLKSSIASDLCLAGGDWSIECWINATSLGADQWLWWLGVDGDNEIRLRLNTSGSFTLMIYHGGGYKINSTSASSLVLANTWHHVAVVRMGTAHVIYLDGASVLSASASHTIPEGNHLLRLATLQAESLFYSGYIDGFRITKGVARYQNSFTPPATPLPNFLANDTVNAFNNVVLLMHFDGANGSTTFTDQKGKTVTAYGNAQISTAQSKFGGASGYFDGTGDYLTVADSADFDFGTNDFTIEFWAKLSNVARDEVLLSIGGDAAGLVVRSVASNPYIYFVGISSQGGAATLTTAWQHHAVSRFGDTLHYFVDGVIKVTRTGVVATSHSTTTGVVVGETTQGSAFGEMQGYIDDLRITKGIARYTANFTPPSTPFPNS